MKKFLVCLMCCFGIFTLCSATSTVGDVYFNNFDILVNGKDYSPTLPVLNYQGRTYLPLNEFGSMTGNDISFANNTISVTQNNSKQKYEDLFFVYSILSYLDKNLLATNLFYHDCHKAYYLTYIERDLGKGFQQSLEVLDVGVNSVNSLYKYRETIVDICVEYNLATIDEVNEMFDNIKYYPVCLQQFANNMSADIISNQSFKDYSAEMSLCENGLTDITDTLNKIQSNISNIILN